MEKINSKNINDQVYEQMLNKIKDGTWKSGDKLPSEAELCNTLGVSRVSVRSALQRLRGVGLVESKQGKGSFVCGAEAAFDVKGFSGILSLSEGELIEIDEARKMIEDKALEILIKNADYADLSELTKEYFALQEATKACDYNEFTKHDYLFHMAIMEAAGNNYLIQFTRLIQNDVFAFLRESNKFLLRDVDDHEKTLEYFNNAFEVHDRIYKAILKRDIDSALKASRSQVALNSLRINTFFTSSGNEENVVSR